MNPHITIVNFQLSVLFEVSSFIRIKITEKKIVKIWFPQGVGLPVLDRLNIRTLIV